MVAKEHQQNNFVHNAMNIQRQVGDLSFNDNRPESTAQRKLANLIQANKEEEELQPKMAVQMQKEEEELQPKMAVQMQKEEEELQPKMAVQMQKEEEELQPKMAVQKEKEEEEIQPKLISQRKENNTGMPDEVKQKMESSFDTDFSDVKVHDNSPKAPEVGALAYTQGTDVHFAPGQYKPETNAGQRLLGHELAHVEQQKAGRVQATTEIAGMPVNDNPSLENEADSLGDKAAR